MPKLYLFIDEALYTSKEITYLKTMLSILCTLIENTSRWIKWNLLSSKHAQHWDLPAIEQNSVFPWGGMSMLFGKSQILIFQNSTPSESLVFGCKIGMQWVQGGITPILVPAMAC